MKKSLEFTPQLYLGESVNPKRLKRIKAQIQKGKGPWNVIVAREKAAAQLEIFEAKDLLKILPYYEDVVIGAITSSNEEACELMTRIVDDCRNKRQDLNLKEYILCGHFY